MYVFLFIWWYVVFVFFFLHWYIWPKSTFPIVIWSYKSISDWISSTHLELINWTSLKFHIKTLVATMPLPSSINNSKLSLNYCQSNIPVLKELENIAMVVFVKVLCGCKIVKSIFLVSPVCIQSWLVVFFKVCRGCNIVKSSFKVSHFQLIASLPFPSPASDCNCQKTNTELSLYWMDFTFGVI